MVLKIKDFHNSFSTSTYFSFLKLTYFTISIYYKVVLSSTQILWRLEVKMHLLLCLLIFNPISAKIIYKALFPLLACEAE